MSHLPRPAASSARTVLVTLAAAWVAAASVPAAIIDFKATAGGGSNWATGSNWVDGTAPANDLATDIARFNQTSYAAQPNAGTSRSVAGIIVGDGTTATAALTLAGTALSLGSSGIDVKAAAGAVTISPAITLGASQVWNNSSGSSLTISAIVSGDFAIEQTGTGTIILNSAASTFSGGFTLDGGTVRINRVGSSDNTSASLGTGTVTLKGGALASTSGLRILSNAITINGNTQLGITETTGAISLAGAVNVTSNSTVSLVNGGGTFDANTVTLNGNLTIDRQGDNTNSNTSSSVFVDGTSAHGLTKTGGGILVLSGANTYSGGTTITAGTLGTGSISALGTGTVTLDGGTLDLKGFNLEINALAGSGGIILDTASAGTRTLTIGKGDGSGSFGAVISQSNNAKIIALTKTGTGTQKFSGANTYMGQTLVSAGTLLINGYHADSSSSGGVNGYGNAATGHFQVASGATFGGSGSIKGNTAAANSNLVLVQSGGHLAPGDGIGAFTLDGASFSGTGSRVLNMASGAVFDFQLSGTGGTPDQLVFWNYASGDLLFNNNALNLSLLGTQAAGTYTVDLFTFYTNSGSSIAATALSSGLVLGTLGSGISSATINYNLNTIGLTYTVTAAVPEPAAFAVLGGLAALLLSVASRRRVAQST